MIVTEQKKKEQILEMLKDSKSVFIVGCGTCATSTNTGGEKQVAELAGFLRAEGKEIVGETTVESTCDSRQCKKTLSGFKGEVDRADTFLVMSCGAGVQTISALVGRRVYPALNSLYLAKVERAGRYYEMCTTCGDCQLDKTGGICLITRCPKNTLNGPCGGSEKGKCEVNQDNDCAWVLIEERLRQINRAGDLEAYHPVKDWTANLKPHKTEK